MMKVFGVFVLMACTGLSACTDGGGGGVGEDPLATSFESEGLVTLTMPAGARFDSLPADVQDLIREIDEINQAGRPPDLPVDGLITYAGAWGGTLQTRDIDIYGPVEAVVIFGTDRTRLGITATALQTNQPNVAISGDLDGSFNIERATALVSGQLFEVDVSVGGGGGGDTIILPTLVLSEGLQSTELEFDVSLDGVLTQDEDNNLAFIGGLDGTATDLADDTNTDSFVGYLYFGE
jgi:hypothetical protein